MRAAQLIAPGQGLTVREVPVPEPGPGEILVRLEACGVCHTDVHIRAGHEPVDGHLLPMTLGHEGIGIVTAVGPDVNRVVTGDRVGAPWIHDTCGACPDCLVGDEAICANQRAHGVHSPGAYADYIVLDERFAVPVPDDLDSHLAAPLMCAGATAYAAISETRLGPGNTAAIFGCGGLGMLAIQYARLTGATVIAIDSDPAKSKTATELGAHRFLASDADTGTALRSLGGADACINFAPTPAIWPAVEAGLNNRGTFVSVALPPEPVAMSLNWLTLVKPTVTGAAVGGRQSLHEALELAARHGITLPIEQARLEDVNSSLDRLAGAPNTTPVKGRIVIDLTVGRAESS